MRGDLHRQLMAYLTEQALGDQPTPSSRQMINHLGCAPEDVAASLAFLEQAGRIRRHVAETPAGRNVVIELLMEGLCLTPADAAILRPRVADWQAGPQGREQVAVRAAREFERKALRTFEPAGAA